MCIHGQWLKKMRNIGCILGLLLAFTLLLPGTAHAAGSVIDSGECTYSGTGVTYSPTYSRYYMVWNGCDSQHTLNLKRFDGSSFWGTVTFPGEWTLGAPAVADFLGRIYIAWVGGDAGHHLNVAYFTGGTVLQGKVTLPYSVYSGNSIPHPAFAVTNDNMYLTYIDPQLHINYLQTINGTQFVNYTTPETSSYGPGFTLWQNRLWLAWVGTDSLSTLNIGTPSFGIITNKTTLTSLVVQCSQNTGGAQNDIGLTASGSTLSIGYRPLPDCAGRDIAIASSSTPTSVSSWHASYPCTTLGLGGFTCAFTGVSVTASPGGSVLESWQWWATSFNVTIPANDAVVQWVS